MLKKHIKDLFTEGLGDIFYMKIANLIKKKVHNKTAKKILVNIYKVIYIIFLLAVAYLIFKLSWPL